MRAALGLDVVAMAAARAAERPELTKRKRRPMEPGAPEYVSRTAAAPEARGHDG